MEPSPHHSPRPNEPSQKTQREEFVRTVLRESAEADVVSPAEPYPSLPAEELTSYSHRLMNFNSWLQDFFIWARPFENVESLSDALVEAIAERLTGDKSLDERFISAAKHSVLLELAQYPSGEIPFPGVLLGFTPVDRELLKGLRQEFAEKGPQAQMQYERVLARAIHGGAMIIEARSKSRAAIFRSEDVEGIEMTLYSGAGLIAKFKEAAGLSAGKVHDIERGSFQFPYGDKSFIFTVEVTPLPEEEFMIVQIRAARGGLS